jgi:hypothetical protein
MNTLFIARRGILYLLGSGVLLAALPWSWVPMTTSSELSFRRSWLENPTKIPRLFAFDQHSVLWERLLPLFS